MKGDAWGGLQTTQAGPLVTRSANRLREDAYAKVRIEVVPNGSF